MKKTLTYIACINDPDLSNEEKEQLTAFLTGKQEPLIKKEFFKACEAASYLSLSKSGLYNLVKKGLVKPVDIGGGVRRYRRSDLDNLGKNKEEKEEEK